VPDQLAAARLARLREALAAAPFDAFLATTPENVFYATGYRSMAGALFRGHQMGALVTAEAVVLVAPCADSAPAADAGIAPEWFVPYGTFYFEAGAGSALAGMPGKHATFADALAQALRAHAPGPGGSTRLLGVDTAGLDPAAAAAVEAAVGSAAFVDGGAWALDLRGTKLPGEVELLRTAAGLAEQGIEAALAAARPGVSERELATAVAATMVAGGGEPRFVVVTAGERSALADAYPSDYTLRPGDLLRFDVGCVVGGYWSDMARTAVCGEPSALQAARYAALLAGEEAEFELLRPGVASGKVFEAAVATVEGAGFDRPYRRHHCGHGIGAAVYEPPLVSPGVETPLRAGMTLCLETPYYEIGWGGMMVEDTIVVTDSGYELLTSTDRGLRVVPA
jgi:Xaa-Pro aminopeptidase